MDPGAPSRKLAIALPVLPDEFGLSSKVLSKVNWPLPELSWKSTIWRRTKLRPHLSVCRPSILVKLVTGLKVFSYRIVGIAVGPPIPVYPEIEKMGKPSDSGSWFEFGTPNISPRPSPLVGAVASTLRMAKREYPVLVSTRNV